MKKLMIVLIVLALAQMACSTAAAPTATPQPTYTPYPTYTPVPAPTQAPRQASLVDDLTDVAVHNGFAWGGSDRRGTNQCEDDECIHFYRGDVLVSAYITNNQLTGIVIGMWPKVTDADAEQSGLVMGLMLLEAGASTRDTSCIADTMPNLTLDTWGQCGSLAVIVAIDWVEGEEVLFIVVRTNPSSLNYGTSNS